MSQLIEELEIFILTYNRADMLKVAIESCLKQTARGVSITILDNASTDHTAAVVKSFNDSNVHFLTTTENIGGIANIKRCQSLCSKKYVMIFHDDDQLHPTYLETAYRYLKEHEGVNVVVTNASTIPAKAKPDFSQEPKGEALKLDKVHFSAALYVRNKIAFCSAVYTSEALKLIDFEEMKSKYGKWCDRPILIEAVGYGSAILLTGSYVFSGRHDAQDTHLKQTQPPYTVWLNREKFFRDLLGDRLTHFTGLCFCVMSRRRLKSGFKRRIQKGVPFSTYKEEAFNIGSATKRTWNLGVFAPRVIQRMVDSYSESYLRKRFSIAQFESSRSVS